MLCDVKKFAVFGCLLFWSSSAFGYYQDESKELDLSGLNLKSQFGEEEAYKLLASPFAIAPNKFVMPTTSQELTDEGKQGLKKLVFEASLLTVDESTRTEIMDLIGAENLTMSGGEIIVQDDFAKFALDTKNETVKAREATLKGQPTVFGSISKEKFNSIQKIVKAKSRCNFFKMPNGTVYENQLCTMMDGVSRPFVVGVTPEVNEKSVKQIAVTQRIEDGVILQQKGKIIEGGIRVAANYIINQITDVDTFTFSGSVNGGASGVTVQVPTCEYQQVNCQFLVKEGSFIFVDPNFTFQAGIRKQKKGMAGRWFPKEEIENTSMRKLLMFSAKVIE